MPDKKKDVKVQDLSPKKDAKGGRNAIAQGGGQAQGGASANRGAMAQGGIHQDRAASVDKSSQQ
jgi:hypothetical protein